MQGEYKQAFENFSHAYSISRTHNCTSMLQLSRVLSGTAHAHETLHNYARHINTPSSRTSIARLLDWKDNRAEDFDRPFTPPPGSTFSVGLYTFIATCHKHAGISLYVADLTDVKFDYFQNYSSPFYTSLAVYLS